MVLFPAEEVTCVCFLALGCPQPWSSQWQAPVGTDPENRGLAPPSTSHVTRATEHVWAGRGLHKALGREGKWGLTSSPAPGSVLLEGGFLEGHLLGRECPSSDPGR